MSLADLKGLTDTLKGEEGISFDTMVIKYESNKIQMDIKEIFLIGPSISILIDGYVEKSGLISLRGTLVPKDIKYCYIKSTSSGQSSSRK